MRYGKWLEAVVRAHLFGYGLRVCFQIGCVCASSHEIPVAVPNDMPTAQQIPANVSRPRCHNTKDRVLRFDRLDITNNIGIHISQEVVQEVVDHAPLVSRALDHLGLKPRQDLRNTTIVNDPTSLNTLDNVNPFLRSCIGTPIENLEQQPLW